MTTKYRHPCMVLLKKQGDYHRKRNNQGPTKSTTVHQPLCCGWFAYYFTNIMNDGGDDCCPPLLLFTSTPQRPLSFPLLSYHHHGAEFKMVRRRPVPVPHAGKTNLCFSVILYYYCSPYFIKRSVFIDAGKWYTHCIEWNWLDSKSLAGLDLTFDLLYYPHLFVTSPFFVLVETGISRFPCVFFWEGGYIRPICVVKGSGHHSVLVTTMVVVVAS